MCLNNISIVQPPLLSVVTQVMKTVLDGLRANKTSVLIQDDEVTLAASGACFATLNNWTNRSYTKRPSSVGFFPSLQSPASYLSKELLEMFRPVSLVGPDARVILQVWLLSQGFTQVTSLASSIVTLRELCEQMLPRSCTPLPGDLCACLHTCTGWGLQCLKRIVANAGSQLARCEVEVFGERKEPKKAIRVETLVLEERPASPGEKVVAANAGGEHSGDEG